MKKVVSVLFLVIFLMGCNPVSGSIEERLEQRLEETFSMSIPNAIYSHTYYSYYREPSIGRIRSDYTSNIFSYEGYHFVMNLLVPEIIHQTYYSSLEHGLTDSNGLSIQIEKTGTFSDRFSQEHPYTILVYPIKNLNVVYLCTDSIEFYSVVPEFVVPQIANEMMKIARTVQVDRSKVLADFSSQETIAYEKKKLELFQYVAPENGSVEELFVNNNSTAGQQSGLYFIEGDEVGDEIIEEPIEEEVVEESQSESENE